MDLSPCSGRSPGEGNGTPLQCSCLENPMDGGHYQLKNVVWGTQGPPMEPGPRHGHTVAREPVRGVPGSWRPLDSLLYV